MKATRRFFSALRSFVKVATAVPPPPSTPPRIGLALGGGFARGIAHVGVLQVLEAHQIPIHCIAGVSAGSIVAAAYASGATPAEIAQAGCAMRFGDVARWSVGRMGFVVSERMKRFLERLLKSYRFEEMRLHLGVLATDLCTGESVSFRDQGDVFLPIRASCSYPGLFQPLRYEGRLLVDGAMSMEIPALLARQMGATHVISVHLPGQAAAVPPTNMFQVVNRCFQIMQTHTEQGWRQESNLVITPDVSGMAWDSFGSGPALIQTGETATLAALPTIQSWLAGHPPARKPVKLPAPAPDSLTA
ncbi:MAG TPA: patatin-like phospholipase family protein [Candidatus Sulfopaludibacter sp.]|jgi:NTE family protein|nr:patatin-like phospholipase family protein [Candidatus Sulfopaludibacter sp.]